MKLNLKAFTLTCGIIWGLSVFCLAWWLIIREGVDADPTVLGRMYPGFSITPLGSVIGLAWGFIDGAIGGAVFAWLYNCLSCRGDKMQAEPVPSSESSE